MHLDVPNHDSLVSRVRRANPFAREFGFIQPPHHLIAYRERPLRDLLRANVQVGAYANDPPVFGQLLVQPSLPHRLLMKVDAALGTGSLLVELARAT